MSSSASHSTSPAFQFYLHEWRGSRSVQRMTWQQRGMYLEMLLEQVDKGSVPDCPRACAELLGGTDDEWLQEWPVLRRKFIDRRGRARDPHDPNAHDASRQLINVRMARVLKERHEYRKKKELAGRNGGHAKAQKLGKLEASSATAESSSATEIPSNGLANPSPLLISTPLNSPALVCTSPPSVEAADARSNRPIYKGQRFVVLEWMFTNLRQMLGSHVEAFGLDEWFYELDSKAAAANLVIPQRERWQWIHDQTLAEASRRGLPIALTAQPASSKTAGNAAALARFVARGKS